MNKMTSWCNLPVARHTGATLIAALSLAAIFPSAGAQTLATGDSRHVTQPSYPAVCATLTAQFTSAQRATPPAAAEDDTSRVQAALNDCAGTGKSVVLAAAGPKNAFYTGSLTVNGAGLVINQDLTLYGNDYASNPNLLDFTGTNASLMGPGTVDGRGDIISGTSRLVQAHGITNFIVYNVTLAQARHPNLYVKGGNGFTAWSVSIRTPANRHNADGIDIDSLSDATVINSSIEAGDDGIAMKTNASDISNVTVSNTKLYGTHGLSVGGIDKHNVTNILFENNTVYGVDLDGIPATDANAINIKTGPCELNVKQVSYINTCIKQGKHLILMDTNYNKCTGSGVPSISDVVVNGVYSVDSVSGAYTKIKGQDADHPIGIYLANIHLDATKQSDDQFGTVGLDNSNDVPSGNGIVTSNVPISGSVPSCSF